jgi:hypothetical protein
VLPSRPDDRNGTRPVSWYASDRTAQIPARIGTLRRVIQATDTSGAVASPDPLPGGKVTGPGAVPPSSGGLQPQGEFDRSTPSVEM